ncbi:MAG: endolytic transglycosylase MltG [Firmicutes bacterium]|nr:endolytic transglycosylase MltG [Bacillota bacterium]
MFAVLVFRDSASVSLSSETQTVEIYEGEGISEAAEQLKESGIIKYPFMFKIQAKLGGYAANLQPGSADITDGMSYEEILALLTTPNRSATKIVIPEGYEVRQIAETLCEAGIADWDRFYEALNDEYDYRFLENLPERENRLEGYLFPATYEIPEGMSEHDIINLMLSAFDNQFKDEYYDRAEELGMTVDQIITLASIIERETDSEAERAKVAGVFYNRLTSDMKLQSCATVQYILGERKPVLAISDTQIDSPYNTYMYSGLPIGPIANPGLACIEAALYPEETDAYYFVQGSDGQHIFSTTYEEHLAAMQESDPTISVDSTAIENQDSLKSGE